MEKYNVVIAGREFQVYGPLLQSLLNVADKIVSTKGEVVKDRFGEQHPVG